MIGMPDNAPVPRSPSSGPTLGGSMAWVVLTVGQFAAVVAVLQRSSLGVAASDTLGRFGITAATLATFSVLQLLVYAGLQVPVGVLIDSEISLDLSPPSVPRRSGCTQGRPAGSNWAATACSRADTASSGYSGDPCASTSATTSRKRNTSLW